MLGSTRATVKSAVVGTPRRVMEAVEITASPTPSRVQSVKRKVSASSLSQTTTTRNVRAKVNPSTNSKIPTVKAPVKPVSSTTTTRKTIAPPTKPTATRPASTRIAKVAPKSKPVSSTTTVRTGVASKPPGRPPTGATRKAKAPSAPPESTETETKSQDESGRPKIKKRPAWDTKGRLEDMEELMSFLKQQIKQSNSSMSDMHGKLSESEAKIDELESFRRNLEDRVEVKEKENDEINRKASQLENQLSLLQSKNEEDMKRVKAQYEDELLIVTREKDRILSEKDGILNDLAKTRESLKHEEDINLQLRNTISSQSANALQLESEQRTLKNTLELTEDTLRKRESRISELEESLAKANQMVASLESELREEETQRRKLHNTIQELKGNIRVFCKVRPLLGAELSDNMSHISFSDDGKSIELYQVQTSADGSKTTSKNFPFQFDKVFQPSVTQTEVFEEIAQLVQSALDGYPVSIFAYGQTGSGKTFTMEGPDHPTAENMGVIPRAVLQIYETANLLKGKGWEYTMEGQYVEIYNETIHDLLGDGDMNKKHEIRHLPDNKTVLTDVTIVSLNTPEKVTELMKKAGQNRAVAATLCNERSSRSHSVFTLRLTGNNSLTGEISEGVLNLIDLAGSERLSSSKSTGDRLKETQAINKSLSSLGDVIFSLANKENHVPYRNSKLTYLLQNALGGNSKTLMFVNVSPLSSNFGETLCSLRFATKVNNCQIGTARKVIK
ncbi:kinesin-like nuclear fusion protein [Basidiobolus ranarum]|uniref:Kinesin-like protein n=1 Tax=Basidiobolus ranarum TaxID=34480 RepID=A0ABR2WUD7_9FUNG